MDYKYNGEKIELEKWRWIAKYSDGSELKQFGDDGIFHRVGEIDQSRLASFGMTDGERSMDIIMPPGAKAIHKYRHIISHDGAEETRVKLYIFGCKSGGVHVYNYIMPDGRVIQSQDEDLRFEF